MAGRAGETKLSDWDISRDAPYFGFEIPDAPGKYFYVWLDAPIGYFGSLRNLAAHTPALDLAGFTEAGPAEAAGTEMYHFIGKDILYFHALFWPAMLAHSGYRVPTKVFAHGFLTVDGQKMSKSRGTFITAESYLQQKLDPEWLRYYYAAKLNGDDGRYRPQSGRFHRPGEQRPGGQVHQHRQPLRGFHHQALRRQARRGGPPRHGRI